MGLLGIFSIFSTIFQGIKEATTPTLTAEHWANKELQHRDRMNGMSEKEILKNAQRGRYYVSKDVMSAYPVPHRERDGRHRVIIENNDLYKEDVAQYGAYQAQQWVQQGKYNLTPSELEIENLKIERHIEHLYYLACSDKKHSERVKEIDAILATKNFDFRNTEAVNQWQSARAADPRKF